MNSHRPENMKILIVSLSQSYNYNYPIHIAVIGIYRAVDLKTISNALKVGNNQQKEYVSRSSLAHPYSIICYI